MFVKTASFCCIIGCVYVYFIRSYCYVTHFLAPISVQQSSQNVITVVGLFAHVAHNDNQI